MHNLPFYCYTVLYSYKYDYSLVALVAQQNNSVYSDCLGHTQYWLQSYSCPAWLLPAFFPPINQSTYLPPFFNQSANHIYLKLRAPGGNWDPTDKKCTSVPPYRQKLPPAWKAFPQVTTACICFTQSQNVCNSTPVLQEVQMLAPDMAVRWALKHRVLLVLHTTQ